MDPREEKLPQWAQQLIKGLRERADIAREPLVREVAKLRPQVELLRRRNEALTELLECAAKGGHPTAQEIIAIIGDCDLILRQGANNAEVQGQAEETSPAGGTSTAPRA